MRGLGQNAGEGGGGQAGSRHETIEKTSNLVSIQARDHGPVAPVLVPTNIIKSACVCRCIESVFWRRCLYYFSLHALTLASDTTGVCNLPLSIRFEQRITRYCVYCRPEYLIKSGYMESCLTAQKRFFLFKGPG